MSDSLSGLERVWPSNELPGYREHPVDFSTYSGFAYDELPPVERELDDELEWLYAEPEVPNSLGDVDPAEPPATRPATRENLEQLLESSTSVVPAAFAAFVGRDEPRRRVRSCTACYLDLGEFVVPVADGGFLLHFLSDQQWVLHWLLYCGPNGSEAVVVTPELLGFVEHLARSFTPGVDETALCAESFAEFVYRFWIENEIWFRLSGTIHGRSQPSSAVTPSTTPSRQARRAATRTRSSPPRPRR